MPGKSQKCCCCPDCTIRTELCCPCVCPAICVTFTPANYGDCDVEADEFDWDESISGYQGTLAGHDLYYYIERDPPAEGQDRGTCMFKLRSVSLGYPEGYELEWEIPCSDYEETPCTTCSALQTEVGVPADPYDECASGTISTYCVSWITPQNCSSCHCLCECLCVSVTKDGISYSGKACWEEYLQAYVGSLIGTDQYGNEVALDVSFPIARWGDVCDDADYLCDPYSDDCAIGVTLGSGEDEIAGDWQLMSEPCELRAVNYSWTIDRDIYSTTDDITVSVWCATCSESCTPTAPSCCHNMTWPTSMSFTIESVDGELNPAACLLWGEETTTLTYDGTNWTGQIVHDLFWTEEYEMVFEISVSGGESVGSCFFSITWWMRDIATGTIVGDIGTFTLYEGSDLIVYESCDNLVDKVTEARDCFETTGAACAVLCCDPPFLFGVWSFAGEDEPCVYEFTATA